MLSYILALSVLTSTVALLYARWEYHRRGRLTLLGLFLLCAMLFVPNLILDLASSYELPDSLLDYIGVFVGISGIVICLIGMIQFGSIAKVMCQKTGELTLSGIYRWSRNPQYVGWLLFLIGFALTDWSLWCLAALLVVAISLHLLVLVEEEHLLRVFGSPYRYFCQKTPRYFGWSLICRTGRAR